MPQRPSVDAQSGPLGSDAQPAPLHAVDAGMFAAPLYSAMRRDAPAGDRQRPPLGCCGSWSSPTWTCCCRAGGRCAACCRGSRSRESAGAEWGGARSSCSGSFPQTRMMIRGVIGVVMVSPVRFSTGPARPGWAMTLVPLLLRPPDGGAAIRRERLLAASTGRAPVSPAALVAGTRGRVTPRHPLRVLRLVASGGGMRRHRGVRLVRTSVRLTRDGRATGWSVGGRRFPRAVRLCRVFGPVFPPFSARL